MSSRAGHGAAPGSHRFIVESSAEFLDKAALVLEILRAEVPECRQRHVIPALRDHRTQPA